MKIVKSIFKQILPIFLIVLNCATFKSEMKGKLEIPAQKNLEATGVNVGFIFSHYRQTMGYDAIPKLENQHQRIRGFDDFFGDALQELTNIQSYATFTDEASDINDPVRRAQKDSLIASHDFIIKMKFVKEKSFASHFLGTLVSSVSATLIPVPYTYSYKINCDVYNRDGHQLLQTYNRQVKLTKWVQSAMIFLYPFYPEKRKQEEIYVECMHDMFKEIETGKVLVII